MRDGRGRATARAHEQNLPPLVLVRAERQADLAHSLGPYVQRRASALLRLLRLAIYELVGSTTATIRGWVVARHHPIMRLKASAEPPLYRRRWCQSVHNP